MGHIMHGVYAWCMRMHGAHACTCSMRMRGICVAAHRLDDRVGGSEEDHAMQVHDEHGRALRVDGGVVGRGAQHLGALELQGGALEHARVA